VRQNPTGRLRFVTCKKGIAKEADVFVRMDENDRSTIDVEASAAIPIALPLREPLTERM
jgi:hypothetical protein